MFDLKFAINLFPKILSVAPITIGLSVFATLIGTILAVLIVIARERKIKVLGSVAAIYVSFIRGTPIIVQMYVVYYGLPQLLLTFKGMGLNTNPNGMPAMLIAILAYSFNAAAYISERIRSAYHSVDYQQYE
ncbi:MAG: ABC transporter permease subunit, partial [Lactobacillus sp.]|nr:ABC transporter permease subunit [Lactobacillus sp.]